MNGLYNHFIAKKKKKKTKSSKELSTIVFIPTNYPTDLTDEEWKVIEKFFPYGNQSDWHKRSLVNAVRYINKTGCQWRMLPKDYPPHDTVWSFYRRAKEKGIWGLINDELVKLTREKDNRASSPSYALIDSQSAKTVSASEERGIDGGKKIKGRKRHIVTDTMGNVLSVKVHAANIHDTKSGIFATRLAKEKYPTITGMLADCGYRKTFEEEAKDLGISVSISPRIKRVFEIQPKRWVVERTFSWMNHSRRLSKDYEITTCSEESMVLISHSMILLKRLCFS